MWKAPRPRDSRLRVCSDWTRCGPTEGTPGALTQDVHADKSAWPSTFFSARETQISENRQKRLMIQGRARNISNMDLMNMAFLRAQTHSALKSRDTWWQLSRMLVLTATSRSAQDDNRFTLCERKRLKSRARTEVKAVWSKEFQNF